MKTTVAIIDSYAAIREMLGLVLEQEGGYEIVANASSGVEAMKLIRTRKPRLVILDLALPEMNGLEVLRYIRAEERGIRVIVFSTTLNPEMIIEALREEPHGYVTRDDSLAMFRETLRAVSRGSRHYSPSITELHEQWRGKPNRIWTALTGRERVVLQLVAEGKTSKEVARRLSISPKTVGNYRMSVMQKLNLPDVTALTRYAIRRGLISTEL